MNMNNTMARPDSQPFDPEDLARRLDLVLAQQHLQEIQSGKQDSELLRVGRRLRLRGRKSAAPAKDDVESPKLGLEQQPSHSSSKGELRKSRWAFRTRTISSTRQSDDECASAITPQHTYTAPDPAASARQAQSQRDTKQKHDQIHSGPHNKDRHTLVLDWKHIDDVNSVRPGTGKDNGQSEWTQTGAIDSRSRGIQLLKRISSISTLRSRFGGEADGETTSRGQIVPIPENGPMGHRKSSLFLRLRR